MRGLPRLRRRPPVQVVPPADEAQPAAVGGGLDLLRRRARVNGQAWGQGWGRGQAWCRFGVRVEVRVKGLGPGLGVISADLGALEGRGHRVGAEDLVRARARARARVRVRVRVAAGFMVRVVTLTLTRTLT